MLSSQSINLEFSYVIPMKSWSKEVKTKNLCNI